MPTNLNAEAKAKWKKFLGEKRPETKLKALEEFYSAIPKHKGNEKLRAQIKRKISGLKLEIESRKKHGARTSSHDIFLRKEGAAQIVILGITNVGKSSLLSILTNAKPPIANYEYTTTKPIQGMLEFENLKFQLIEAPALIPQNSEDKVWNSKILTLARNSDGLILMVDLSRDCISQLDFLLNSLEDFGISIYEPKSMVDILKEKSRGVQITVSGQLMDCSLNDVKKLAYDYGIRNAIIRISGENSLEDIENAILENKKIYKSAIIIANKLDIKVEQNSKILKDKAFRKIPIVAVSCDTKKNTDEIGKLIFRSLEIIRIYTKEPGGEASVDMPFIMKNGSSVIKVAKEIHSDLFENFRYARIWGSSKYPGEKVGRTHTLKDEDIVEIHTK